MGYTQPTRTGIYTLLRMDILPGFVQQVQGQEPMGQKGHTQYDTRASPNDWCLVAPNNKVIIPRYIIKFTIDNPNTKQRNRRANTYRTKRVKRNSYNMVTSVTNSYPPPVPASSLSSPAVSSPLVTVPPIPLPVPTLAPKRAHTGWMNTKLKVNPPPPTRPAHRPSSSIRSTIPVQVSNIKSMPNDQYDLVEEEEE